MNFGYINSSGGGGNATVPNDAPIQPAQAYVDNIIYFTNLDNGYPTMPLPLSNKGITFLDADLIHRWFARTWQVANLSGNALSESNVNAILARLVADSDSAYNASEINLSGGTNAAPTITPAAAIASSGESNINVSPLFDREQPQLGKPTYGDSVDGNSDTVQIVYTNSQIPLAAGGLSDSTPKWVIYDPNGDIIYFSTDDVAYPWLITTWQRGRHVQTDDSPASATLPVVTQTAGHNRDKAILQNNGWTVTTN